jgi:hypothetical protein
VKPKLEDNGGPSCLDDVVYNVDDDDEGPLSPVITPNKVLTHSGPILSNFFIIVVQSTLTEMSTLVYK